MAPARGLILQASYRVISASPGRRIPVVHIYGRLESGDTFLVRDDRQRPHFYVRDADAGRARALRAPEPQPTDRRSIAGDPVSRLELETPQDIPGLRDRLHAAGIETFEADVMVCRALFDRSRRQGRMRNRWELGTGRRHRPGVFERGYRPCSVDVRPRVLSFDIETDLEGDRLLAISLYAPGIDEVLIVDEGDRPMPDFARRCSSERAALDLFCARVKELDPDVLTGWNVIDFDLAVLQRIAMRLNHPLLLGREPRHSPLGAQGGGLFRQRPGLDSWSFGARWHRPPCEGLSCAWMSIHSMPWRARCSASGKAVVGDTSATASGKSSTTIVTISPRSRALRAHRCASRLPNIGTASNLIRLACARVADPPGMTPDRVAASIASFDFLYLTELERRAVVAPSGRSDEARTHPAQQGGHVLEPAAGLHRNVWVFDFKSLYPSIIRTFNIDPLSYVEQPLPHADLIRTVSGAFAREPAILPRILDELFPRREAAKKAGDGVASHAIKILMNSFYGVLGAPACRFYNPALVNSITGMGRELLLWSKAWFESAGFTVLYGDTDSLFVDSGAADPDVARERGRELAAALNAELDRHIFGRWRVASRLELEFEKLYLKLFLPRARQSTRGASKRYAGLLGGAAAESVEFVGMEVVRRDWTALAKQVQRELYHRLFTDQSVDAYLADVVHKVRNGDLDSALVYRKNLRKGADEYTATTPPHVAAARKSIQAQGRLISYVMTTAGAEPLDNVRHPLDRNLDDYVVKQVKPVAEPVLETLGLDFERVIGDRRQLDLYS